LRNRRTGRDIMTAVALSLIFAFALGVLVYVGGALLQLRPAISLEGVLTGVVFGLILVLARWYKMNRER
jgi:high-affinity Fe2+/Pb2+ permease